MAAGGLWWIISLNGLSRLRNGIQHADANLDARLKDRYDRLPDLVASAKRFMAHEHSLLNRVLEARNKVLASPTGTRNTAHAAVAQAVDALRGGLLAYAERYLEVKSDKVFDTLLRSINEVSEQISASREDFNSSVTAYNNTVDNFPASIVAKVHGFARQQPFSATAVEKQKPKLW